MQNIAVQQNLNSHACQKFIDLCKENPSQEWDGHSVAALCPDDDSKTADFLVEVAQCIKTPSVLENDPLEATLRAMLDPEEQLKRMAALGGLGGLGGLANLLGLGALGGGGGDKSGDKKTKSKYQFK